MFPRNFKQIGYLSKIHGIHGSMLLRFEGNFDDSIREREFLFVSVDGTMIPFSVEEINISGAEAFIKLRYINTEKEARKIIGSKVFFPVGDNASDTEYYSFVGFRIIDETSGFSGTIEDFLDTEMNPLFLVNSSGKDRYIPAREEFILHLEETEKEIIMRLPEGLFDLND